MRYGFNEIKINPQKAVKQAGFIQQVNPIEKVHDDLHARILILDDNHNIFIHISCDSLGIKYPFQKEVEDYVKDYFDKPLKLLLSCTHTHFAGDSSDENYRKQLFEQITNGIKETKLNETELIEVSYSYCDADGIVGTSRISHHKANVVLGTIALKVGQEVIATIIYHNCHPTIMSGADTDFFSSEYPGYVINQLKKKHSGQFFTYLQGASGDISTRFTREDQTYDSVIKLGDKLVDRIEQQENNDYHPLSLSFEEEVIECHHEFNEIDFGEIPDYATERELETIGYGKIMRQRLQDNPERLQKKSIISKVSLGPVSLVFAPNELFSGYIDYVDLNKALLVCYTNGYSPYVTPIDKKLLTYETFTDTLTKETKEKIANAIYTFSH